MHKNEAAALFGVLSHPDRVKVCKMLYVRGKMSFDDLSFIMGMYPEELLPLIQDLFDYDLVIPYEDYTVEANKERIDELMSFITTPCGCCHSEAQPEAEEMEEHHCCHHEDGNPEEEHHCCHEREQEENPSEEHHCCCHQE